MNGTPSGGPAAAALSIFSRTWPASDAAAMVATVRQAGFAQTHLNLASVGLSSLPETLDEETLAAIRRTFEDAGVRITSVSATYNLIHPDRARRRQDTERAVRLIRQAPALGVDMVSLCAGTRNPDNMWAWHPGNETPEAWADFRETLGELLVAARRADVKLGIEPDDGTMIPDAGQARRLLDELGQDADLIGIILDPGNIVDPDRPDAQRGILSAAFDQLGAHIEAVHAKDRAPHGDVAPGDGVVDFDYFFARWAALPKPVPVVLHNLGVDEVEKSRTYALARMETA